MAQNEKHELLIKQLMVALSATGVCRVWKQNTGKAYRDGRWISFGIVGGGDITGILLGGRRIEIECKTGGAKQHEEQRNFGEVIRKMGGIYIVARDVETVVKYIKNEGDKALCNFNQSSQ